MNEKNIIKTPYYRKKGNCIIKYQSNNTYLNSNHKTYQKIFSQSYFEKQDSLIYIKNRSSSLSQLPNKKGNIYNSNGSSILQQLRNIIEGDKKQVKNEKQKARRISQKNRSPTSVNSKACLLKTRNLRTDMMIRRKKSKTQFSENDKSIKFATTKFICPRSNSFKSMSKSQLLPLKQDILNRKNMKYLRKNKKQFTQSWEKTQLQPWNIDQYIDLIN